MRKWYREEWHFTIEVLGVGKEDRAEECRIGLEPGDTFECDFETPAGFCPTAFIKIFPSMEAVRCEGDLRHVGGDSPTETACLCPAGVVTLRLAGNRRGESA